MINAGLHCVFMLLAIRYVARRHECLTHIGDMAFTFIDCDMKNCLLKRKNPASIWVSHFFIQISAIGNDATRLGSALSSALYCR